MTDILQEIVAYKRVELERQKQLVPPRELYARVERLMADGIAERSMSRALAASPYGIIAEFKRKSPSKGWIHENALPVDVVPKYAEGGASALSILTDNEYFGGRLDFIPQVRDAVEIPILRKEFIIDEYQLFEAREAGADAVLLIAADLSREECRTLTRTAHDLKLEVLLEMHSEEELDYLECDPDMAGINNRNLGTFRTDVANSFRLAEKIDTDAVKVSESGISNPDTVRLLRAAGFRGFLMGECFMKNNDPGKALAEFIAAI
ncbi:MAG: indole-3-glycerol phosphate synthase TrpC [Bacteroidaceae bacterium]|nr:indole-3-glycerol phosphate synthase TrpC [Bacteroidaceae bacterium]